MISDIKPEHYFFVLAPTTKTLDCHQVGDACASKVTYEGYQGVLYSR